MGVTLVTSIMKLIWKVLRAIQESKRLRSNLRFTDSSSQMVMVSLFWLRVDFSTWDAPLVIHPSLCPAPSPTKLLLKSTFGRTEKPPNTKKVKYTSFLKFLTRKSPDSTCQPSKPNSMTSHKSKPTTFQSPRLVHSSTISTD